MFRIIQEFTPRWVVGENVKGITNIQDGMVFEAVCTDLEGTGYEVRAFNIPAAGVGAPHRRERIWIVAHTESCGNSGELRNLPKENEKLIQSKKQYENKTGEFINAGTTNVVDTISNGEGREISRSHEEKRRIQEEHRQDDSSCRLTSRTSSVRQTNDGHEDVANTKSSLGDDIQAVTGTSESETQEVSGDGSRIRGESAWWDFEPDVGRVAHGIPGRVYRLKGLGNSIIPQIAQEIGNAIIKAESEE